MKILIYLNDNLDLISLCKIYLINLCTYYICLKIINKTDSNNIEKIKMVLMNAIISLIYYELKSGSLSSIGSTIILIFLISLILLSKTKFNFFYMSMISSISLTINYLLFAIASIVAFVFEMLLNTRNELLIFILISIIYCSLVIFFCKIKRIKNGFSFLYKNLSNEFFELLLLNISAIILFLIILIIDYSEVKNSAVVIMGIIIFSFIIVNTIRESIQFYYKYKLLIKELEETKQDLTNKEIEITKLEQENLNFSKKSHSLDHKQKALEYKLNQLILKTETAEELNIKDRLETISKELYKDTVTTELTKTEIPEIDDMLEFMQSECKANNIDFNLQITGNIFHMINNLITKEELEILIADHIKDAIIAIKHTDNINKSILVKLGKIEECYGLYIYDSGIEFEKETLENLGKKPNTTHADEGGTGMGFMNTFDTLRKHKASLIIEEIGETSKDNYTKVIKIKFDNKNEFKINSYKQNKQDDKKQ